MATPSLALEKDESLVAIASALAGTPVEKVAPIRRGGNSRVFRVESARGSFALKIYPPQAAGQHDRLKSEEAALGFLRDIGLRNVPRLIAADRDRNAALLEWVDGTFTENISPTDIDAALAFLARLHERRTAAGATACMPASEACLAPADAERHVASRFSRLTEVAPEYPALAEFLRDDLAPAFEKFLPAARAAFAAKGIAWAAETPPRVRTLSPSDFGFHNSLRRPDGSVVFLDFEYFGWDDPAKLVCDTVFHPGMNLSIELKLRFVVGAKALFGNDPAFAARLDALYPLFGLRWCAILLNEFLPEKWALRAGAGEPDADAARTRQLAKAQALFRQLLDDDPIRHAFRT